MRWVFRISTIRPAEWITFVAARGGGLPCRALGIIASERDPPRTIRLASWHSPYSHRPRHRRGHGPICRAAWLPLRRRFLSSSRPHRAPRVLLGFGSYLGDCTGADDDRVASTAHGALTAGVNLLDTAINYRCQRRERALGEALARAVRNGDVARDEVVVCTKGGYIPLDGTPPESRDAYRAYLATEYFDRGSWRPPTSSPAVTASPPIT